MLRDKHIGSKRDLCNGLRLRLSRSTSKISNTNNPWLLNLSTRTAPNREPFFIIYQTTPTKILVETGDQGTTLNLKVVTFDRQGMT